MDPASYDKETQHHHDHSVSDSSTKIEEENHSGTVEPRASFYIERNPPASPDHEENPAHVSSSEEEHEDDEEGNEAGAAKDGDAGTLGGTITRTTTSETFITGFKLMMVLAAVSLVVFVMLLDISVVATAIPQITTDFHSLNDVGWYGSAYLLANCTLQPLAGKLYAKFRTKWVFFGFFALFELGSLICGVATSSTMLIVGRAVAGMGGAGLQNGGLTIVSSSVPLDQRPLYLGIIIGVAQIGGVVGPLIGGAFTEYTTWRWCFYINLPIGGLVALFLVFVYIPDTVKTKQAIPWQQVILHHLDLPGFALFAPSTIQLLLALDYGGNTFPWNSATVIGLFCGSGATFIVFLMWEYFQGDEAMIPLSMLKRTIVWTSCLVQVFFMSMAQLVTYYLPIYFQAIKAASPMMSGVYLLPSIGAQLVSAVGGGRAVTVVGYYLPFALIGNALASIGHGLLSTFTPTTSTGEWVGYQILVGFGRGLGAQMAFVAVQNTLPPVLVPISTSLLTFSQTLGGAVFLTIGETLFSNSLRDTLATDAVGVNAQAVVEAGATGLRGLGLSANGLQGVLQAYSTSVDRVFYLAVGCSVAAFGVSWGLGWKDIRKKSKKGDLEKGLKGKGKGKGKKADKGREGEKAEKENENGGGVELAPVTSLAA